MGEDDGGDTGGVFADYLKGRGEWENGRMGENPKSLNIHFILNKIPVSFG
jgi:hypothetical protein